MKAPSDKKIVLSFVVVGILLSVRPIDLAFSNEISHADKKFQEAEAYFLRMEFQKGIDVMLQLIEADPNNAEYHSRVGGAYNLLKNRDQAIAHLNKAIELEADNPDHYMTRSLATAEFIEQESWLLKALEIDPQHDGSIAILASMYIAVAISEEAKCNYRTALESVQKGITVMEDYIALYQKSPKRDDPELMAIMPDIIERMKDRLIDAIDRERNLKKLVAAGQPC